MSSITLLSRTLSRSILLKEDLAVPLLEFKCGRDFSLMLIRPFDKSSIKIVLHLEARLLVGYTLEEYGIGVAVYSWVTRFECTFLEEAVDFFGLLSNEYAHLRL